LSAGCRQTYTARVVGGSLSAGCRQTYTAQAALLRGHKGDSLG
jgi:hypothetical protein